MKNANIILRTLLLFIIAFIAAKGSVSAQTPFIIKVVEKPSTMSLGQKYTFAFDVQNVSKAPLTMSSSCAVLANVSWKGSGSGSGCGTSRVLKSSFFTLQPKEKKRFEVEVEVPKNVDAKFVYVNLRFAPNADGKEYGFQAVIGEARTKVKVRIV